MKRLLLIALAAVVVLAVAPVGAPQARAYELNTEYFDRYYISHQSGSGITNYTFDFRGIKWINGVYDMRICINGPYEICGDGTDRVSQADGTDQISNIITNSGNFNTFKIMGATSNGWVTVVEERSLEYGLYGEEPFVASWPEKIYPPYTNLGDRLDLYLEGGAYEDWRNMSWVTVKRTWNDPQQSDEEHNNKFYVMIMPSSVNTRILTMDANTGNIDASGKVLCAFDIGSEGSYGCSIAPSNTTYGIGISEIYEGRFDDNQFGLLDGTGALEKYPEFVNAMTSITDEMTFSYEVKSRNVKLWNTTPSPPIDETMTCQWTVTNESWGTVLDVISPCSEMQEFEAQTLTRKEGDLTVDYYTVKMSVLKDKNNDGVILPDESIGEVMRNLNIDGTNYSGTTGAEWNDDTRVDWYECINDNAPFLHLTSCLANIGVIANVISFNGINLGITPVSEQCRTLGTLGEWLMVENRQVCPVVPQGIRAIITPFIIFMLSTVVIKYVAKRGTGDVW